MAGLIKSNVQLGDSATATQNFTLSVPATPDGTVKLARGNAGATTQDIMTVDASGVVAFPQTPAPSALSTASGSAPSYSTRAWVSFNGTGTIAINASGNVTSLTDNAVGDYTVNFTTALPDANYALCGAVNSNGASQGIALMIKSTAVGSAPTTKTTSACRIFTAYGNAAGGVDSYDVSALFIR